MPRKHFTTSLEETLIKAIKKLAIDLDRSANDLLEEGIRHLLAKYGKQAVAPLNWPELDPSKYSADGSVKRIVKRTK